jgi:hypothetical protein|eukprot:4857081-Prymnesium_polylepis.2
MLASLIETSQDRHPWSQGHTFCTRVLFDDVAAAIGECAFVTTELPIILSLEVGFENSNRAV